MDGRKQCAAESVKKKVTNKVNILVKSNSLSIKPITPPRSQVEELQQATTIVLKSKYPAKWCQKIHNRKAQKVGRPAGELEVAQEAHVSNVCNQIENREKNTNRLLRARERSDVGAKVTTRVVTFENAADALLTEISEMLSVSKAPQRGIVPEAAKPFKGQAQMINLRSAEEAKVENADIKAEILNGLCPADATQICRNDRLGLVQKPPQREAWRQRPSCDAGWSSSFRSSNKYRPKWERGKFGCSHRAHQE